MSFPVLLYSVCLSVYLSVSLSVCLYVVLKSESRVKLHSLSYLRGRKKYIGEDIPVCSPQ